MLQWGARHFLKLSVSISLSPSQSSFMERKSIRSEVMALEHSFFFERSIFDSLEEREK